MDSGKTIIDITTPLLNGKTAKEQKATVGVMCTLFNILNIYVGLGLLSKPFSVFKGGLISIVVLWCVVFQATYTGWLTAKIFAGDNNVNFGHKMEELFNKVVGKVVCFVVCVEYLMANCICLIFIWRISYSLSKSFGFEVPYNTFVIVAAFMCVIPVFLTGNPKGMAMLNMLGFVASVLIVMTVGGVFLTTEMKEIPVLPVSMPDVAISTGIFITSLAGHATLPKIQQTLKEKQHFTKILVCSFITMGIIYTLCGLTGSLAYGSNIEVLITENMIRSPGGISSVIVSLMVVLSCYFSVGPFISVLSQPFECEKRNMLVVRLVGFIICCVVSFFGKDYLELVESQMGIQCSLPISTLVPLCCAIKMKVGNWYLNITLLFIGVGTLATLTVFTFI